MKTKEEIYCNNGGSYIRSQETEGHLKSMQEYSDQQLAEYKISIHNKIMTQWEADFGSIHKDISMDVYTVSGFVRKALES